MIDEWLNIHHYFGATLGSSMTGKSIEPKLKLYKETGNRYPGANRPSEYEVLLFRIGRFMGHLAS